MQASHPSVGWLVHISLNFSSVGYEILHPPIFQRGRIRSRKYGLHAALTHAQKRTQIQSNSHPVLKNIWWTNHSDIFLGRLQDRLTACGQGGCGDPVWCLHAKTSSCLQQKEELLWAWNPGSPYHHSSSWEKQLGKGGKDLSQHWTEVPQTA